MKVELLVAHRRERYEGEHAPEVLAVCDEVTLDDNPSWWPEEIARQKQMLGDDVAAMAVVTIELSTDALWLALYPKMPPTDGLIVDSRKV